LVSGGFGIYQFPKIDLFLILPVEEEGIVKMFRFCLVVVPSFLLALPAGMEIVGGEASLSQSGSSLDVAVSQRAVLNWDSFSIQNGEVVRFLQPNADAAVLNRVVGGTASLLDGLLQANGRVYLVNPQGVVIGPQGRIDTAAFIAAAIEVSPEDFLQGLDLHFLGESLVAVSNLGTIESHQGPVVLIAHQVYNQGTITATETASLIAGHDVLVSREGRPEIAIRPDLPAGGVDDAGSIQALTSQIVSEGPVALAVNREGVVQADKIYETGGRVYLWADGGTISFNGIIDASGDEGGSVSLRAPRIDLSAGSIDVSGQTRAGFVEVGPGPGENAKEIRIGADVVIAADSHGAADAGHIVILSDERAEVHGALSARAWGPSGDGGVIEISGRENLYVTSIADLRSAHGRFGQVIHDPTNITIQNGADVPPVGNTYTDDYIGSQLSAGNFTLTTAPDTGTVTFDNSLGGIFIGWSMNTTFQILASSIVSDGLALAEVLNGTSDSTPFTAIDFRANTGNGVPAETGTFTGINFINVSLASGIRGQGGDIRLEGRGGTVGTCPGVVLNNSDITGAGTGSVSISGTAGGDASSSFTYGVYISGGNGIAIFEGNLSITGAGSSVAPSGNIGVFIQNCDVGADGFVGATGNVSITSTSGRIQFNSVDIDVSTAGQLTIQSASQINIGGTSTFRAANGPLLLIANTNIVDSGTSSYTTTGGSGTITFVADNAFPNPPGSGTGLLTFPSTATFSSSKVNFFAGRPGTSTFPATINGLAYSPGTLSGSTYTTGTNELVGYWYLTAPPPSLATFQISYKPFPVPPATQVVNTQVVIAATDTGTSLDQIATETVNKDMNVGIANQDPTTTCTAPGVWTQI
jgi:filamentous hemagglutinin family protein